MIFETPKHRGPAMKEKAEESAQIKKARKKIEKRLQKTEGKTTPEALHAMDRIIREQLNRKKTRQIDLRDRQFTFDENQHSAKIQSKVVLKLIRQIENSNLQKNSSEK